MLTQLRALPRLSLVQAPTPLHPALRLSEALGGPTIWLKREDLAGLGQGGNKLRKLEPVMRAALADGADCIVSAGVVQSNSLRQVAAAAARCGLDCHFAVFQGRVRDAEAEDLTKGNALLTRLFGAHLHMTPWTGDRNGPAAALAATLRAQGRRPALVPYGVTCPLGAMGFASVGLEIAAQAKAASFDPKAVIVASGSGGTQAGLVLAAAALEATWEVLGVDVDAERDRVHADVLSIAQAAALQLGGSLDPGRVRVIAGHPDDAYGAAAEPALEAMGMTARLEGIALDPVYNAKAAAALIALVRRGSFTQGDQIVLVVTGGDPALFAYSDWRTLLRA